MFDDLRCCLSEAVWSTKDTQRKSRLKSPAYNLSQFFAKNSIVYYIADDIRNVRSSTESRNAFWPQPGIWNQYGNPMRSVCLRRFWYPLQIIDTKWSEIGGIHPALDKEMFLEDLILSLIPAVRYATESNKNKSRMRLDHIQHTKIMRHCAAEADDQRQNWIIRTPQFAAELLYSALSCRGNYYAA